MRLKLVISPWHLVQNMEKYLQFLFSNLELDLTCFIHILITRLVWGGKYNMHVLMSSSLIL